MRPERQHRFQLETYLSHWDVVNAPGSEVLIFQLVHQYDHLVAVVATADSPSDDTPSNPIEEKVS